VWKKKSLNVVAAVSISKALSPPRVTSRNVPNRLSEGFSYIGASFKQCAQDTPQAGWRLIRQLLEAAAVHAHVGKMRAKNRVVVNTYLSRIYARFYWLKVLQT
jgi:hypothetical protein